MTTRSIGFRLSAWYFLVFALGISAFSIAAWFAMRASLYHAADEALAERVLGVERFMQLEMASLSTSEIRDEFREQSVTGPGGDLLQVADGNGVWLYRSGTLEDHHVPIARPADLAAGRFDTSMVDGHVLRFYSEGIRVGGKPYSIQVAAPMDELLEALQRFRIILLFTAPLLLLAASAGGYWISRRALAPVDAISRAAQRISIQNMSERLDVPKTGDELARLSETLNEMLARLESSVRKMTQFTADASHELRAPVSLIRTTAEVAALNRQRPAGDYLASIDEILEEAERTSQVVDSLMLLARADSSREFLDRVPVDAASLLQNAAGQGQRLARNRGVAFALKLPPDPIQIQADPDALRRALLILMDNAAKYTPSGGSVEVGLEARDHHAVAYVSDTGIGIDPSDLPHVFDRFWRADKARSREQGGAGLGLSIAKSIVEMHGGRISARSSLGKGSTFEVSVPIENG